MKLEDGIFKFFYVHKNNTLLDRLKLVSTKDDLTKLKDIFNETDATDFCSRERKNTKRKFFKFTNLNVFAALLKGIAMGQNHAVSPEALLRNGTIN